MMDSRRDHKPQKMVHERFTHGQSHWAMSGMVAGCKDRPNPGPEGEETYVHIAKCGCDLPAEGEEKRGAQALLVVTAPTNLEEPAIPGDVSAYSSALRERPL